MANMQPIIDAFEATVDSTGVKFFADKWRKSRQYIEKFWNPDEEKKLPVEYLMDVMLETGDVTALDVMARQLGYRLIPEGAEPETDCIKSEALEAYSAASEFLEKAVQHKGCKSDLLPLRRRVSKEFDDVLKLTAGEVGHMYHAGENKPRTIMMGGKQ